MKHVVIAGLLFAFAAPTLASQQPSLLVGPTVYVSTDYPRTFFRELTADADPLDPQRLVACIMMMPPAQPAELNATAVLFRSVDGGATWSTLLESRDPNGVNIGDPVCKFDSQGGIQYMTLTNPGPIAEMHTRLANTWQTVTMSEADRETIITGPSKAFWVANRAGSLEGLSSKSFRGARPQSINIFRSPDRGRSFTFITGYAYDQPYETAAAGIGGMFTDGSVVIPVAHFKSDPEMSALPTKRHVSGNILALTPRDVGKHQPKPNVVSPFYYCRWDNALTYVPVLAVDTSTSRFRNRAYLVWGDYRNNRCQEMISISTDHGHVWSAPRPVSDDRSVRPNFGGPDDGTQAIAVNNRGVVGVMWYDRRNAPDDVSYQPRFAVSLDGGRTFSRSVALTNAMNDWQRRYLRIEDPFGAVNTAQASGIDVGKKVLLPKGNWSASLQIGDERGGETAGLTADTNGVFHAFWVDNRTNVDQMYTATVAIAGQSQLPHATASQPEEQFPSRQPSAITSCPALGAPRPQAKLKLHFDNTWVDQDAGLLSTDVYAIPDSAPISSPLVFTIATVKSKFGSPSVVGANGQAPAKPCFIVRNDGAVHLVFHISHYQRVNVHRLDNVMQYILLTGRVYAAASANIRR